jgi:hypothetical protein
MGVILRTAGGGGGEIVIDAGVTITLFMDPAGDDNNNGLTAGSAVATLGGLNNLVKNYRFASYSNVGSVPRILVLCAAGNYVGGFLDLSHLGYGRFSLNDTNQAVVWDTSVAIRNGDSLRTTVGVCTYNSSGFAPAYTSTLTSVPRTSTTTTTNGTVSGTTYNGSTQYYTLSQAASIWMPWRAAAGLNNGAAVRCNLHVTGGGYIRFVGIDSPDIPAANTYAPIIFDGSMRVDISTITHRNEGPMFHALDGAEVNCFRPVLDRAAATTYRYMVAVGNGSSVKLWADFGGLVVNAPVTYDYVFRVEGAAQASASARTWQPEIALIDNEYNPRVTTISNGRGGHSPHDYGMVPVTANTTFPQEFCLGRHYVVDGAAVNLTVHPTTTNRPGRNTQIGSSFMLTARNGASFNIPVNALPFPSASTIIGDGVTAATSITSNGAYVTALCTQVDANTFTVNSLVGGLTVV